MRLHYRKAKNEDLKFILDLEKNSFPDFQQSDRQKIKRGLKSSFQEIIIVEDKDERMEPLGSIILFKYIHSIRIYSIAIVSQYRSKGIGNDIIRHVKDFAIKNLFTKISLEVRVKNERLIKWYEDNGFKVVNELEDYYKQGENAYKMICNLDEAEAHKGFRNIVVIDRPFKWEKTDINAKIISE